MLNGGDDFSYADTLAAFFLFSDDFERFVDHITSAVINYKIVVMLNTYIKKIKQQREKNQVNDHIKHYRENMMIAIAAAADDFEEIVDGRTGFRTTIMKKTSKAIGNICDELLNEYEYEDILDLLAEADDVDISDFIVEDDEYDKDEYEGEDETDN